MEYSQIVQIKYYQQHMFVRTDERINNWTLIINPKEKEEIERLING